MEKEQARPFQVLFVDDEENIVKALRRLFADDDGLAVMTATSGEEGLRLIADCDNLALVISDQRMPSMSGVEFLEQVKTLAPDAVRIVLTGYADINAAMGAINRGGAYRYLTKPWEDDDLVRNVMDAVGLFKLKQENKRLNELVKKQNQTLEEWNARLKSRVLEQTRDIVARNDTLNQLNAKLHSNFQNSISAFANLMDLRDKTSRSHAGYVADLAARLATDLKLPPEEVEIVRTAGLLHDIGKIGIREELLKKNLSEMNAPEMLEYQTHSVRGQAAIDAIEELREAGRLIRHHHECFNGKGWPDRLAGEDIPLGARIVALADYVDRVISQTPIPDIIPHVLVKVARHSAPGGRFDPALLPLLKGHLKEIYGELAAVKEKVEVRMEPRELMPGMILARNVISGTGLLLLNKGAILHEDNIKSLQRYYLLDPPREKLMVWSNRPRS
ncbi:MAG: HD domain-containing protein [Desulfobulbaceae bacterium]|nr:HD domain-containing protein [Desulfobulbaceae bacterium]